MMQHYLQTKEAYPDCILFYRLGDFYEMFFEDAKTTARELELTLTGKQCGLPERAPMCGVPYHAVDTYLSRLVEKGYKVAICEQVEDPKLAKGMVKREVVRVVTPGTVLNAEGLDEARHNYLMSIVSMADVYGVAVADISTGECLVTEIQERTALLDEILKFMPSEILCNQSFFVSGIDIDDLKNRLHIMLSAPEEWYFDQSACEKILKKQFHVGTLKGLGITDFPYGVIAAGALFTYLYETQKSDMRQITAITPYYADRFMLLDSSTRRNLELTETLREKQKRGSLLWVLDRTKTAMGARLLRGWVEQPLIDPDQIARRLSAVETLCGQSMLRDELREYLQPVYDLERLISRIVYQSANPRDLVAFRLSLEMLPHIQAVLGQIHDPLLEELASSLDPLEDLCTLVQNAILDEPPLAMKEGGIIRDGYDEQVDRYRSAGRDGKKWLSELEEAERERTGIRTLRIRFNKVFGYCIEITNSFKDKVPEDYIRRQTLTNAERYTMPKLKEVEETILGAEDRLCGLEYELFSGIRDRIGNEVVRIQNTAAAIAALDVLASLSFVAERNQYVRPQINTEGRLCITDGRHPVVEQMIPDDLFIPNDTSLDKQDQRVSIITGPNMAGKSTYMRQVALIVLMAQIGSFVPAAAADIGIADRIFTRVGASDDLASGKSTFMVEMNEVANILRNATSDSLLILDEIGRGTSTFDGLSIAWAVVEYIADRANIGARTLFATHYHELTELEGKIPGVQNYCIAVKEKGDDIVFLRKIIRGGADRSYGIQVARLAGVPDPVLSRAEVISAQLQDSDITEAARAIASDPAGTAEAQTEEDKLLRSASRGTGAQLSLFETVAPETGTGTSTEPQKRLQGRKARAEQRVLDELRAADLMRMTPIDALNLLYRLQNEV